MNAPEMFELQMSRHIRAPRERVCDAFLSADELRRWMCPRGMSVAEASVDAREGGRWRLAMLARDGSRFVVGGEYRQVKPPERLVFTWQWEAGPMPGVQTLIEVTFSVQDGGTLVQMRHGGFPAAAARDAHGQGWNATLNKLTEALDPRGTAATLTLLGDARSTYTRTARMGLAEKGVGYTLQACGPHSPAAIRSWSRRGARTCWSRAWRCRYRACRWIGMISSGWKSASASTPRRRSSGGWTGSRGCC
jgi:glutathione S-transferase